MLEVVKSVGKLTGFYFVKKKEKERAHACHEYRGLTQPYKTGLYGEECLLFINSSQDSYLSEVGLNPT